MEDIEDEINRETSKLPVWVKIVVFVTLVPLFIVGIMVLLLRFGAFN